MPWKGKVATSPFSILFYCSAFASTTTLTLIPTLALTWFVPYIHKTEGSKPCHSIEFLTLLSKVFHLILMYTIYYNNGVLSCLVWLSCLVFFLLFVSLQYQWLRMEMGAPKKNIGDKRDWSQKIVIFLICYVWYRFWIGRGRLLKQRRKKRDGSSFSLEKESNHRNVWIYVLEDAKGSQQHDFKNKRSFHIRTKKT